MNNRRDAETQSMKTDRDTILQAASNGNALALDFLRAFARRAHWVDDIADGDANRYESSTQSPLPTPEKLCEMEAEWLLMLAGNVWFIEHRAKLVPLMLQALNAWVDSQQFGHKPDAQAVMKGMWHEVVWAVALCAGGKDHQRAVSARYRSYDFEHHRRADPNEPGCACCNCMVPLPEWKFTILTGDIANAACESCFNQWRLRPVTLTGKEANELPG